MVSSIGLVLALAAIPHGSAVSSLTREESVVRRERAMQVTSEAVLVPPPNDGHGPRSNLKMNTNFTSAELAKLAAQFCNYDFPLGSKDTNFCTDPSKSMIHIVDALDPTMCIEAAIQSGASAGHHDFMIPQGTTDRWEYKRPAGCFAAKCGASSTTHDTCYYWNGVACTLNTNDTITPACPKDVAGTPVCQRPRHLYGAQDAQGGCPDGYQVIEDEETCRSSATCLGHMPSSEFRVGVHNASKHLDHPEGCFIVEEDGHNMTYFNPSSALGKGTNVKGKTICNVSSTVSWSGGGGAAGNSTS